MISPSSLSIDQLLRAAQLLEQQQTQAAAAAIQMGVTGPGQLQQMHFCKLGEDYQERLLASKMRSAIIENPLGANSTGSSRRSSPISSMFSNCSSAQSASPPNSPSTILISSMTMQVPSSSFNSSINSSDGLASNGHYGNSSPHSTPSMSTRQSRAAHNELEKNRRANLRSYLDNLKTVLPADVDSTRDTTLSLLTRARNYLRATREQKERLLLQRNAMLAERLALCRELEENDPVEQAEKPVAPHQNAPVECTPQPQQSILSQSPCDITSASVAKLCFTPPAAFLEKLNLGSNSSPSAFSNPAPEKRAVDLYMDGLLPAVPLLYPYTNQSFGLSY